MADVQTGFGPFVSFYLASQGWSTEHVGFALTIGGLSGVAAQLPGGALVDAVRHKRLLVAIGVLMIAVSAILLALWPNLPAVCAAELLHGATGGIIGSAIGTISLGLVGRRAMSARIGRNQRFDAAGNALTAAGLGMLAQLLSKRAIFFGVALLAIPTLVVLSWIRPREIAYGRARNASGRDEPGDLQHLRDMLKCRGLLAFAGAAIVFRLDDASILPLVSEDIGSRRGSLDAIFMAVTIIVPQLIVAVAAPWVGHYAEQWGRKPALLIGFGLEPIRGALLVVSQSPFFIMAAQTLDGIVGAIVTVMTVLVITDLTTGTGRFNLARGAVGTCTGIAAAVSTTATGVIAAGLGREAAFLTIAAVAILATVLLWQFCPKASRANISIEINSAIATAAATNCIVAWEQTVRAQRTLCKRRLASALISDATAEGRRRRTRARLRSNCAGEISP